MSNFIKANAKKTDIKVNFKTLTTTKTYIDGTEVSYGFSEKLLFLKNH